MLQEQMVIFDGQRMGAVMGFPRIMAKLGLTARGAPANGKGVLRLGHGKPILEYHLVAHSDALQKAVDESIIIKAEGSLTASALGAMVAKFESAVPQLTGASASGSGQVAKRKQVAAKVKAKAKAKAKSQAKTNDKTKAMPPRKHVCRARDSASVSAARAKARKDKKKKGEKAKPNNQKKTQPKATAGYLQTHFVRKQICWLVED